MLKFYCSVPFITKVFISLLLTFFLKNISFAQDLDKSGKIILTNSNIPFLSQGESVKEAKPLEELSIIGADKNNISISDGKGRIYKEIISASNLTKFTVGGALGTHTITVKDKKGKVKLLTFNVDAKTNLDDHGKYAELFNLLHKGMLVYSSNGVDSVEWNGKQYHFFICWVLDNYQNLKGMQYFSPYGQDLVDLFRQTQRADGMIWSNVQTDNGFPAYFDSEYEKYGYSRRDGKVLFVRQPVENMVEYLYVNMIYQNWKGNGNDQWMKENLSSASRALDYCMNDQSRWSDKYKLLKRAYTIDSWDFQIADETTANIGINSTMVIDPQLTKFGIFYGDNTGYAIACEDLATMFEYSGNKTEAEKYRNRAKEIRLRLNALAWNGRFFTHRIEEDPTIKRDLGVNEKSQISLSNAYSINRNLPHEQNIAIIKTYQNLKANLPEGSPSEVYAIYPPFEKGFAAHNDKWQYMNGGIAGHAIGELARGAYENGFETYGTDILDRFLPLIKKHDNRVYFAYTGSIPSTKLSPNYKTIDLSKFANMSLSDKKENGVPGWMDENKPGNDLKSLPIGEQKFNNIPFLISDPQKNNNKTAVALSSKPGLSSQVEVPVNNTAGSIYLLHTGGQIGTQNIAGSMTFKYIDGTKKTQYIIRGIHFSGWWFPELDTTFAGIAWRGSNTLSKTIGLSWAAINNPEPTKKIQSIVFNSTVDGAIYTLLGMSLSDIPHQIPVNPVSFGGPDNWAAATSMAALIEGLAGVTDEKTIYNEVKLSPRWTTTEVNNVDVTTRYAASDGYVAYHYEIDKIKKQIKIKATGSGNKINYHILLPEGATELKTINLGLTQIPFKISSIENSKYVDFSLAQLSPSEVILQY